MYNKRTSYKKFIYMGEIYLYKCTCKKILLSKIPSTSENITINLLLREDLHKRGKKR